MALTTSWWMPRGCDPGRSQNAGGGPQPPPRGVVVGGCGGGGGWVSARALSPPTNKSRPPHLYPGPASGFLSEAQAFWAVPSVLAAASAFG